VQQGDSSQDTNRLRQAKLVDAFLAAARAGDFAALLAVLDPDVVLRADETAVQFGQPQETRGTEGVLEFSRRAGGAKPALVDGAAAGVWMTAGQPRVVYSFTVDDDKITAIDLIGDPVRLREFDLTILDD